MLPPIIRLVRMILLLGRVCVQFAFVMDLLVGFVILLRVRLRLQRPNLIFIPVLDLGCLFRSSRLLFCCCFVSGSTRLVCFAAFGTFFFLLVARLLHLIFRSRNFCFVVSSFVIGFVSSSRSFAFFVFRYSLLSKVGFVAKVWRGFLVIFKLVDMYYIVSSVYLDPQADFIYFFSPRKKNTAMSTNMDRSPCLARHTPFRRLEIDDTITFKLSTKKKPKNRAARGAAGMFVNFAKKHVNSLN
jgi:hypothetical protein